MTFYKYFIMIISFLTSPFRLVYKIAESILMITVSIMILLIAAWALGFISDQIVIDSITSLFKRLSLIVSGVLKNQELSTLPKG